MKLKEFKVNATSNKIVQNEVKCHFTKLGYDSTWVAGPLYYAESYGDVSWGAHSRYFKQHESEEISLDDFFKLTKEDVIVEPERFVCDLNIYENSRYIYTARFENATQEQVDRIKEIMNEVEK